MTTLEKFENLKKYISNKERDWDDCARRSQELQAEWGLVERELNAAREQLEAVLNEIPTEDLQALDDEMNEKLNGNPECRVSGN